MFSKILIANRGEVAVRVIRACKEMGIETVAVYSDADADSLHVVMADESYCIGGPLAKDSYLNMNSLVTLAKRTGVSAIHPGYGMLAENADFAKLCEDNGIAFIGPSASVMRQMGQKETAREIAKEAGAHIYCDSNKGVVFANKSMISFHTGTPGEYTLKAKSPVKWTMVFPEKRVYPEVKAELTFTASEQNTYIFMIEP